MDLPKKVACVGSGTIGSSWALLFALRGNCQVIIYDISPDIMKNSMKLVENMLGTMVDHELITGRDAERALGRVETTTDLERIADCDYVQESAIERIDTKVKLLGRLEGIIGDDVVIASSTSGLSMTTMQQGMKRPERSLIAHPFNPPHLVPLVEVVSGEKTSPRTVEQVSSLMHSLGKVPVRINRQLPGFAANRLQTAVLRESLAMLGEGVVDADGLEKIMSAGIGLRWAFMGSLVTANLAGGPGGLEYYLDHFGPLTQSICETLSDWTTVPDQVKEEAKRQVAGLPVVMGKSYPELVKWRDENLIGILKERGYL